MHRDVSRLAPRAQPRVVLAHEPAEREPAELRREIRQQRDGDDVAWYRVAEEHEARGHVVEVAVVPDRLPDAERDADCVGQDQRRDAVEDRHREAPLDRLPDGLVVTRRAAEIEDQHLLEPVDVAHEDRLVEAVVDAQLLELRLRQHAARDAARAQRAAAREPLLVQHPLDRPARHDASDCKNEQRDAQEGRDDQQEAADEITGRAHESQRQRDSGKYPTKHAAFGATRAARLRNRQLAAGADRRPRSAVAAPSRGSATGSDRRPSSR